MQGKWSQSRRKLKNRERERACFYFAAKVKIFRSFFPKEKILDERRRRKEAKKFDSCIKPMQKSFEHCI